MGNKKMELKKAVLIILIFSFIMSLLIIPSASAQKKPEFTLDIACVLDPNHPVVLAGNVWAKLVAEKSNGRIKATVYPNSQLGGNRETIQATQNGLIQGYLDTTTVTSNFVPQMAILDLPYLAENTEKAYKLLDGPIGDELSKYAIKAGIRPLGFWEASFRNIYTPKIKVNSINDVKGMKIRVIPSPSFVTLFKALGASPTPMPFGELYTALAQGVVDAAENDMLTYHSTKHFEVAKNMAITNHIFLNNSLFLSEKYYEKLPADIKKIMNDSAKEAETFLRKNRAEREKSVEEQLKKAGVNFTTPDLKPFIEKGRGTYPEFEAKVGKDLIKKVLDAVK